MHQYRANKPALYTGNAGHARLYVSLIKDLTDLTVEMQVEKETCVCINSIASFSQKDDIFYFGLMQDTVKNYRPSIMLLTNTATHEDQEPLKQLLGRFYKSGGLIVVGTVRLSVPSPTV
jgi:hypothetical protein